MAHQSELIATDIGAYLESHEHKSLLRFITCGSVDDGKSTLIGRLLYESKMVFEDQLSALERDSKKVGTRGGELDFALLVDGLAAEREQGITIDVAYRFFSTERRKFIVADTPGARAVHAQHGDRRLHRRSGGHPDRRAQGRAHPDASPQLPGAPARHLARGARGQQDGPRRLLTGRPSTPSWRTTAPLPRASVCTTSPPSRSRPCTATTSSSAARTCPGSRGRRSCSTSRTCRWPTRRTGKAFRLPVQWVNRPHADFRGFAGQIASGSVQQGDRIRVLPSGRESQIARIVTADGDLPQRTGRAVGHGDPDVRGRRQPRRCHRRGRQRARRSPASSRRPSCGCTRSRCCRDAPT